MTFDATSAASITPADAFLDIWTQVPASASAVLPANIHASSEDGRPAFYVDDCQSTVLLSSSERFKGPHVSSYYHCNPSRKSPRLDQVCRDRVLQIITEAGARNPNGSAITEEMPQLSLKQLQVYCDSFFSRFNDSVAVIHRPTFQPSTADALLLLAVILLGAGCGDDSACQMALCIYDALPGSILQHQILSKNCDISCMQVLFLMVSFGRLRGGQPQYDIAHLYHTLLVQ